MVGAYKDFLKLWNAIIANRDSSLLDKTINIFTTNIDNLVEKAAEDVKVEFNDGFQGHLNPIFREDSFNNVLTKISPLYQNLAQIPVFNYMKIHGSINWQEIETEPGSVTYDSQLSLVKEISAALNAIPEGQLLSEIGKDTTIKELQEAAEKLINDEKYEKSATVTAFMEAYKKLIMIHPRKAKFRESVLDSHFYELMRRYSNSLEQVNSVLFVSGFSFADEHLAKITMRAANTNPTLQVIVFAYDEKAMADIKKNLEQGIVSTNHNVHVLTAQEYFINQNEGEMKTLKDDKFLNTIKKEKSEEFETQYTNFSLSALNKFVFSRLLCMIR